MYEEKELSTVSEKRGKPEQLLVVLVLFVTEANPKRYRISSVIRQFFSFQNNPKNLDLSYKMDLNLWDCFGRVNLVLWQNFLGLI